LLGSLSIVLDQMHLCPSSEWGVCRVCICHSEATNDLRYVAGLIDI
jgi:hypothetical protein